MTRFGLPGRILVAGVVVVVFLLVAFAFVIHAFRTVRNDTRLEHRASQATVAALRLEDVVASGRRAEARAASSALLRAAPGAATDAIDRELRAYLRDPGSVERAARVRALLDSFTARSETAAGRAQARTTTEQRRGLVVGAIGAVGTILLFAGVIAYLLRTAAAPRRQLDEMSRSLATQQRDLAAQNVDLERLANVLRAVLDSTVDGILLSDADGHVQLANRPVINLTRDLGMNFDGTVVDRLLSVEHRMRDRELYHDAMERLRANPEDATFDEFEDAVSGRVFQGFTSPVRDDRGGFLGRIWTLREVTQQRELDRLKDEFVATVSHELRTPLTSMMGFLEMIREGEAGQLTDEQKRFLAIVYRSSERLQRLVGDLLFVARLDASGLQLQFADVRVHEVVGEVVESSSALARARDIELTTELQEVPPVWADRERLSQLVSNLVSNAIKFTPSGGTVVARTFSEGGDAVIQVEDSGIGIPEGEQDRLFQRFFRSSTATEQAIPGTGLGLVIARAIAESHGGSIGVRSARGEGTCFTVRLPMEPEEIAA
jgi:signal transduction histidine kinase